MSVSGSSTNWRISSIMAGVSFRERVLRPDSLAARPSPSSTSRGADGLPPFPGGRSAGRQAPSHYGDECARSFLMAPASHEIGRDPIFFYDLRVRSGVQRQVLSGRLATLVAGTVINGLPD